MKLMIYYSNDKEKAAKVGYLGLGLAAFSAMSGLIRAQWVAVSAQNMI